MKSCSYRHRGVASLSAIMLALLAACGGGGGDEPQSGAAAAPPSAPAGNGSPTPPPAVDPLPQTPPAALFTEAEVTRDTAVIYAREILGDLKRGLSNGKNAVLVFSDVSGWLATGSVSGTCDTVAQNGTATMTVFNPSADGTLNATDSVNRSFNDCKFPASFYYLSGSVYTSVRAFSGSMANGSSWSGSISDSYTNYRSRTVGDRSGTSGHGSVERTVAVDGSTSARTTSVRYQNYTTQTFGVSDPASTVINRALFEYEYSDYLVKHASDSTGGTVAIDGRYIYSEPVNASYRPTEWKYTTETPFRFDFVNGQNATQPSAGKTKMALSMTPINGSRLGTTWELVYVDASTARLNVDLDNNGTTDLSHDLTWAELQ
jgi:hypothetical protein